MDDPTMNPPPTATQPFDKIINFRDVGAYINTVTNRNLLKPGLLFRSARPDAATPSDRDRLLHTFHLKTIIDLRTNTELTEARRVFTHQQQTNPSTTPANPSDPKHPYRIPGLVYKPIDLNGKPYSAALLKHLSWPQTSKLMSLYALGYRKQAIAILGTQVMAPRGLAGLAEDSLEHCTAEVKQFFDVLSEEASYPVLVHCTQGKDRTGLVVLLVEMLVGIVPVEAMERDYRVSETELEPEREAKLGEIRGMGLPDSFADCPAEWVGRVRGWVEGKGGVEKYLEGCGVGREQQGVVKGILLAGGG
ncbi:hypothetical protein B0A54_00847 [Friedmanniomyces endolithicus]|uniref:Tyrosine specific protein phosphatases domain-containing protein n=1 Tax=Friedmanniomyces endolithicus TaxID=329885 RepID=A0A4U0VHI2_9PEZI|nr:hypothetical protein B0A54_00847 [Friedmanniomyces endolithicus]